MDEIIAGVSRVTITPPVGIYLIGMERFENSNNVHDDLFATALAIDSNNTTTIIISMDVLSIHPETVQKVRDMVNARTGVLKQNILICATHNHSGPSTYSLPDSNPIIRAYAENLVNQLVGLACIAYRNMEPARAGFGRGSSIIGVNRRLTLPNGITVIAANPAASVDDEIAVLRIDTIDGKPLAGLVNYSCHPVVLGNGSNEISADWPGVMRRTIETVVGAKVLFLQGACGDINPIPGVPCDRFDVVERLGLEVGGEAIKVWAGIETNHQLSISCHQQELLLPLLPYSDFVGKLPEFIELGGAISGLSFDQLQDWLDEHSPWSVDVQEQNGENFAAMEMQVIRLGDTIIIGIAAEVFVEIGLFIKRHSSIPNTILAAYANGVVGYIPLAEDYARGGYEVNESYLSYRLPSPLAPICADLIQKNALDMIQVVSI